MEINLLIIFIIFNVLNVIIQTIKSIATIRCGKWGAAIVNAIAYGLYTYVIIFTMCELPMWLKALIVALANLVGVYVVKLVEEKSRKDKLWKVEATIANEGLSPEFDDCVIDLRNSGVPMNYIDINKYVLINCYCATQKESLKVKEILDKYNAKYFVSESKTL